jgi:hypothetical protein
MSNPRPISPTECASTGRGNGRRDSQIAGEQDNIGTADTLPRGMGLNGRNGHRNALYL